MRLRALAVWLALAAAVASWLAARDPTVFLVGNAALLWAWAAIAWAQGRRQVTGASGCRGCGRTGVGVLPDGSCAWCATPPRAPAAKGS